MNLTHYLFEEAKDLPEGLASVLADIAAACKSISHDVDRSGLLGLHGDIGAENVQGEQQQILDDKSNTILKDTLAENEYVLAIASEEEDTVSIAQMAQQKVTGWHMIRWTEVQILILMPARALFSLFCLQAQQTMLYFYRDQKAKLRQVMFSMDLLRLWSLVQRTVSMNSRSIQIAVNSFRQRPTFRFRKMPATLAIIAMYCLKCHLTKPRHLKS